MARSDMTEPNLAMLFLRSAPAVTVLGARSPIRSPKRTRHPCPRSSVRDAAKVVADVFA
jgi:hypothetical protein